MSFSSLLLHISFFTNVSRFKSNQKLKISNPTIMVGENKMDKIAKIEIAKKGLIYIFILIDLIIVLYLVSGFFGIYNPYFLNTMNTSIIMILVMVILVVTVKYLADMAIVSLERD